MAYEPRTYRSSMRPSGLQCWETVVAETDLHICCVRALPDLARDAVLAVRGEIEGHIARHPRFAEAFAPLPDDPHAPAVVRAMLAAAAAAGVGPMAAVAGAVAERVARALAVESPQVIVENGGDVYLIGSEARTVGVWAGDGAPSGLGIRVRADQQPLAVCTSSGTIGHSTSFGHADAVAILAGDGALADAVATAAANRVRISSDVEQAMAWAMAIPGVLGVVIVAEGVVGARGDVELASL